jgi:DNA polymerase-4
VQVKVRRADFTTFTRQRRFEPSTTDSRTVARIAAELLAGWLEEQPRARVRLLGVGVNHLHAADQMDLFAGPAAASPSATALDATLDQIRERFGNLALRRGSALPEAGDGGESGEDASEATPSRSRERAAMRQSAPGKPPTKPGPSSRR